MYNLLIVDDEPLIAEGISKIVDWAEYGIEICKAMTSSMDALQYIKHKSVDILITDIKMPQLDGNELIRAVKAIKPSISIIVLSGYNDFEYVRTASLLGIENYLLKPINQSELEKTLYNAIRRIENERVLVKEQHENMRILRENILNLWINGNIEPGLIKEKLQLVGIELAANAFRVVTIRLLPERMPDKGNSVSYARRAEGFLAEYIPKSKPFISFCNGYDEVVLIQTSCSNNEQFSKTVFFERLAGYLYKACNVDVFICVGGVVNDPSLLSCSYNSTRMVLTCSCYMGFHSLVCESEDIVGLDNPTISAEQCRNLRLFSVMGDLNGVLGYIKSIFNTTAIPQARFPTVFITAIYNLYNGIETSYAPGKTEAFFLRKSLPPVEHIKDKESCLEAFHRTVELLLHVFFAKEPKIDDNYVDKMKKVAQIRYSEYLSLKMMSNDFGVSPAYLGSLFFLETGETFSSFVNRLRIEKAKLLLMNKTMKISDISRITGFTTINYFYTVFKKQTDLSPAEYRDKLTLS